MKLSKMVNIITRNSIRDSSHSWKNPKTFQTEPAMKDVQDVTRMPVNISE